MVCGCRGFHHGTQGAEIEAGLLGRAQILGAPVFTLEIGFHQPLSAQQIYFSVQRGRRSNAVEPHRIADGHVMP